MLAVVSVGEIQPERRRASPHKFLDALWTLSGWSDGGHDLGPSVQVELAHIVAENPCGNYHPGVS